MTQISPENRVEQVALVPNTPSGKQLIADLKALNKEYGKSRYEVFTRYRTPVAGLSDERRKSYNAHGSLAEDEAMNIGLYIRKREDVRKLEWQQAYGRRQADARCSTHQLSQAERRGYDKGWNEGYSNAEKHEREKAAALVRLSYNEGYADGHKDRSTLSKGGEA